MPRSPSSSGSSVLISAAASRMTLKLPIRLTSMTRRKASSGSGPSRPTMRPAVPMPAQLTAMRAGPCRCARRRKGGFDRSGVGHIGADREPARLARRLGGRRLVDVEDRDLDPGLGERLCGRPAETRCAAADDCRLICYEHGIPPSRSKPSLPSAKRGSIRVRAEAAPNRRAIMLARPDCSSPVRHSTCDKRRCPSRLRLSKR